MQNSPQNSLTVALTGGIGSGKSLVTTLFEDLGVTIIDTDVIARDLVALGSPLLKKISDHFGKSILHDNGELDRTQLRQRIFNSPSEKKWLEQCLHPKIKEQVLKELKPCKNQPYCLVIVPLLFETPSFKNSGWFHRILVVDAPETLQIERTMQRDQCSREQVEKIMATQASRKQRLQGADDIIVNDVDPKTLGERVLAMHQHYLQLSKEFNARE